MSSSALLQSKYFNNLNVNKLKVNNLKANNINTINIIDDDDEETNENYIILTTKYFYSLTLTEFQLSTQQLLDKLLVTVIITSNNNLVTRFSDRPMRDIQSFNSLDSASKELLTVFKDINTDATKCPNCVFYFPNKHIIIILKNLSKNNNALTLEFELNYDTNTENIIKNNKNLLNIFIDSVDVTNHLITPGNLIQPIPFNNENLKTFDINNIQILRNTSDIKLALNNNLLNDSNYTSFDSYILPARQQQLHNNIFFPGYNALLDMSYLNLRYVQLNNSIMYRTNFSNCIIANCDLRNTSFIECVFDGTFLKYSNTNGCIFRNCVFKNTLLDYNFNSKILNINNNKILDSSNIILNLEIENFNIIYDLPNFTYKEVRDDNILLSNLLDYSQSSIGVTDNNYLFNNIRSVLEAKNLSTSQLNYSEDDGINKLFMPYRYELVLPMTFKNIRAPVSFRQTIFYKCDFSYSIFNEIIFEDVIFIECIFNNTIFLTNTFKNLTFKRCIFWYAKLNIDSPNYFTNKNVRFIDCHYKWIGFPNKKRNAGATILNSNDVDIVIPPNNSNISNKDYLYYRLTKYNPLYELYHLQ